MASHAFDQREDQLRYKGQSRPFVDERDLQFHIPGTDRLLEEKRECEHYTPLYSHFVGTAPLPPSYIYSLPADPKELDQVMEEVQQSYASWKKMHEQLKLNINNLFKK